MPDTYDEWCRIEMQKNGQVLVIGEVRRPGVIALPAEPTLTNCINAAGGFTDYAFTGDVGVLRDGQRTYYDMRGRSGAKPDVPVRAGDTVHVSLVLMFGPNPRGEVDWAPPLWKQAKQYYDSLTRTNSAGGAARKHAASSR